MKPTLFDVTFLSVALALLPGCERRPLSEAPPAPPSVPDPTAARPNQTDAGLKIEMVQLPGGRFVMGDKDEPDATPHEVTVSPFYMDKHEVTQAGYERITGANPSRWKGTNNPVEQVRWSDAVRFCNQRSQAEGLEPCYDLQTWQCNFEANGYRLPTEAEWEYACRAGSSTAYFFGDQPAKLGEFAWFDQNSGGHPHPVGQKQPNAWGLHDLCGNVWEWCHDLYQVDYYTEAPKANPRGPQEGKTRVVRGGAWRSSDQTCRSGYRYNENPGYADVCFGYDIYGFRCVRKAGDATPSEGRTP